MANTPKFEPSPFHAVRDALYKEMRKDEILVALVKERNLQIFEEERKPKTTVLPSDLPDMVLMMPNITGNLHASSGHVMFTVLWRMMISTGSYWADAYYTLVWRMLVVLKRLLNHTERIKWRDESFLKEAQIVTSESGLEQGALNRNIAGWATIIDFETHLHINNVTFDPESYS